MDLTVTQECCSVSLSVVQLADFGLSTTFGHGHLLKTYCGSPLYASPEIVNARPYVGPEVRAESAVWLCCQ